MRVVLFEDEHFFAANVQRGLEQLARQHNLPVVVITASKDWWEFIERLIHGNELPKAPAERAIDNPSRSSLEMVWIIDLKLEEQIQEAGITKLNEYVDARFKVDQELAELSQKVKDRYPEWNFFKPGVAIAAYASQHGLKFRFFSKYAGGGDPHLRLLLSYLLTGTRDPLPLEDVNFDKGELGIPRPGAPMSERERRMYTKILVWIEERDAPHKEVADIPSKSGEAMFRGLSINSWIGIAAIAVAIVLTIIGIVLG